MIIRARPKYLSLSFFNTPDKSLEGNEDELFFNQGRSALKFLFQQLSVFKKKRLTVAIQSFNCQAVIDPALQTGCKIILLDIEQRCFSISLSGLKNLPYQIDVLIITHYQGIPNSHYEEISAYCESRSIFLIDDMAQTEGSMIGDIVVGTKSEVSLHSFAFDKPFTCWEGGSLKISGIKDERFKVMLKENYRKLPLQSHSITQTDLSALSFLYTYSDYSKYPEKGMNQQLVRFLKRFGASDEQLYFLMQKNIVFKPIQLIAKSLKKCTSYYLKIQSERIRAEKINLILQQRKNFHYSDNIVKQIERWLKESNFTIPVFDNETVKWNRYSIIDESGKIKEHLKKKGVEADNFNWKVSLHQVYGKNKNIVLQNSYPVSEFCSSHTVNIPCWFDFLS